MKNFDLIKLKMVFYRPLSRARWLDHYYRTKCEISAEDASWKIST